jgi:hypothetical protein
MTPEQQTFLLLQLDRKWPKHRRTCDGCGKLGGDWEILHLSSGMPYTGRNEIVLGAVTAPMVPVCCKECGWTQWWSAIQLGVVNPEGQQLPLPVQVDVLKDDTADVPEWQMKLLRDGGNTC